MYSFIINIYILFIRIISYMNFIIEKIWLFRYDMLTTYLLTTLIPFADEFHVIFVG